MKILGIDPGLATTGYGIIEIKGSKMTHIDCGTLSTPAKISLAERLKIIGKTFKSLLDEYIITDIAIEDLFFNTNTKTAMAVAQARGVLLYLSEEARLNISSYTPPQIKAGICGYGQASKSQVKYMVKKLLNLQFDPKPDDAADALAIAICHSNYRTTHQKLKQSND